MKYFRETENPTARLPASFMQGFLEVGTVVTIVGSTAAHCHLHRVAIEMSLFGGYSTMSETCCKSNLANGRRHKMPHPGASTYVDILSLLSRVEIVSGSDELVEHNIAQSHEVIEALL